MATLLSKHQVQWEPFDKYGGYNPKGENLAMSIDGVEIFDFWANGRITAPVGSPAQLRGKEKIMRWKPKKTREAVQKGDESGPNGRE
jgi:hypothetical protein